MTKVEDFKLYLGKELVTLTPILEKSKDKGKGGGFRVVALVEKGAPTCKVWSVTRFLEALGEDLQTRSVRALGRVLGFSHVVIHSYGNANYMSLVAYKKAHQNYLKAREEAIESLKMQIAERERRLKHIEDNYKKLR